MMYFAIAGIAALAGFIQSVTGFGAAAVMMAVIPYFFDMIQSPAISTMICVVLSGVMLWQLRRYVKIKYAIIPTIIYSITSAFIISIVKSLNLEALSIAFGVILVILSLYSLLLTNRWHLKDTLWTGVGCSALSGVLAGLFGVGGPTMALYLIETTDNRKLYLASLQFLFFISNIISTLTRISEGIITIGMMPIALMGTIGILTGHYFGLKVEKRLNADVIKKLVYLCVGMSGVIMIVQKVI